MVSRTALFGLVLVVPAAAIALYLVDGRPDLAVPVAERPMRDAAEDAQLIEQLRAVISHMDPHSDQALQGNALLAGAEEARGNDAAAAVAWQAALAAHFNPEIAARAAEALTRAAKRVTPEAAALYRQALAVAPPDAPWKPLVEQRLQSIKPP
jgi:cytochrome c-type biogenesis protein CcmH